ncbi:NYNRIN-like protein [Tanacetum coccineum]
MPIFMEIFQLLILPYVEYQSVILIPCCFIRLHLCICNFVIIKSEIPTKYTQVDEKDKGNDESLEKSPGSKPLEKVVIHDGYANQTITIRGSLTAEYISGLIEILRKHADAFAWTPTDMTGIPRFVAEHELKTYPHIEPRVQRKRSIASDRRKIVKDEAEEAFQAMKKLIAELPTLTAPKKEEELMVYLSAANEAVSVVLLVERDGRQISIHYVSRILQGAEIIYPPMEKLTLALVHAAKRLRIYFQGHTIKVIMDKPISQILNNREATGRLAKWEVELEAYGIKYAPRSAIKAQVLADFLADTMAEDSPTQQEDTETKAPENLRAEADIWKLYTDGASNEHGSREGLILIDPEGAEYSYALRLNFTNSNNDAEYEALLAGLRIATKMKVKKMNAFVDSKLVANQVEGSEENRKADSLRKLAAVQCEGLTNGVLIEEFNERSMDITEVNVIIREATRTWMTQIQEYIKKIILPKDATEARTIQEKARNYTIEEGILYRQSYLGSLLRCIGPQQAKYLIKEIHMGSYGMHDRPRREIHKAMSVGYFWPSMHRDANNEISSCDSCHVYATIPKLPKNDMISVTSAWPFRKWGMDIVGPLLEAPGKIKYLIVAIDYFTKWLEAKPVTSITGKQVKNFAFDNILCRLGVPATIITDNGTQLINDPFKS